MPCRTGEPGRPTVPKEVRQQPFANGSNVRPEQPRRLSSCSPTHPLSSGSDVTVESDGDVTITVGNAMEIETSSTFTVLSDDNVKFISTGGYVRIDADDIQLKGLPTSDPSITNGIYVDTSTGNIKMSGY